MKAVMLLECMDSTASIQAPICSMLKQVAHLLVLHR